MRLESRDQLYSANGIAYDSRGWDCLPSGLCMLVLESFYPLTTSIAFRIRNTYSTPWYVADTSTRATLTSHVRPKHLVRLPLHAVVRRNEWSTDPGGTTWRRKGPTSTARPPLAIAQRRDAAIHYSPDKVLQQPAPLPERRTPKIRRPQRLRN
jgi:hypothetical protein